MKKIIIKSLELIFIIAIFFIGSYSIYKLTNKIKHEKLDTTYIWNIKYDNIKVTEGSKKADLKEEDGELKLELTLKKPKEFYEVTMDIENKGSIDAYISNVIKKIESTDNVLKSSITYIDGASINKGDKLESNSKKQILIRIEYPETKEKIYKELKLSLDFKIEFKALT